MEDFSFSSLKVMAGYRTTVFLCLIVMAILQFASGAKILGVFPVPSKSHMAVNSALMKGLARRGHDVTVVSPFPLKEPIPNHTDIKIIEVDWMKKADVNNMSDFQTNKMRSFVSSFTLLWDLGNYLCDVVLQTEELQNLIHSNDLTFDLVVTEAFIADCFVTFAHKFNAPLVQTCSFDGAGMFSVWMGNPHPVAYIPNGMQTFSDKMNFVERFQNALGEVFMRVSREIYFFPKQNSIIRKYFNYTDDLPHIWDILSSTSLLLLNGHFSYNYPKPLLPNMVQVGGMHVESPKQLPKDLKEYLDSSDNGVIYFSMGSHMKGTDMPDTSRKAFLQVFSKLKQNVLWKWESNSLPGKPNNVKVGKWFPQSDILAHPNVKLFITHGGLLSSQEALIRGVPVVGIPVYADQKFNTVRAVSSGYGILLEIHNITVESVLWAVNEILENPSYHENAQRHSKIFRDQPQQPLEKAVYWTEYVIRHKGAPHMRSAALDLTWYQYYLLDVIAVLVLGVGFVLSLIFFILRVICKKCFASSKRRNLKAMKKKRN